MLEPQTRVIIHSLSPIAQRVQSALPMVSIFPFDQISSHKTKLNTQISLAKHVIPYCHTHSSKIPLIETMKFLFTGKKVKNR